MFKNAMIYRVLQSPALGLDLEAALHANIFTPCGATQEKSSGWMPPRGEAHGLLMEAIGGQHILKLMTETKAVPAPVIKRGVDALAKSVEEHTGRKPGKKERREMADEVRQNCLPHAFTKQAATLIWVDVANKLLVIDASSQAKADDAVNALLRSFDGLTLQYINTQISPAACMARWLVEQEAGEGFTIDRECELKAADESKAVVKYGRHPLDIQEITDHILRGKVPTKLAMTFNDRVSFVLTDSMTLKKVEILDVAVTGGDGAQDGFDADVAIATGELAQLIPNLLALMGGEVAVV